MWSLLALLTAATRPVPPFQLAAMAFAIGALVGFVWIARRGAWRELLQPGHVWLVGVGGLFGYHAFYFIALRHAPPVEAGLIAYLWPLLIVLMSAALPGERLRRGHVAGALLGFGGAALLVTEGGMVAFEARYAAGYAAALACAFIWSSYSVLSRRLGGVPTASVAAFCAAAALLSFIFHIMLEETVRPPDAGAWLAVLGLGLMPVGVAFYVWDIGMKRGDIQSLGVLSYAAPLISTIILVAAGYGQATAVLALSAVMISVGALMASFGGLRRAKPDPSAA